MIYLCCLYPFAEFTDQLQRTEREPFIKYKLGIKYKKSGTNHNL